VVSLWKAEQIVDWAVERVGDRVCLTRVVLADGATRLVFQLLEGFCFLEVLQRTEDGAWGLIERVALKREGVALSFIPFVFHGPRNSRPEPDGLPLADIIAANLDHYRLDADYKQGLHFAALPTAWVSGFDKSAPLRIGSSTAWVSEVPGASAGYLEFSGQGLAHLERAIEKAERRMVLLGARMGTGLPANGLPAGQVAAPGGESELFGLGSMVASLNGSLSQVLRTAQWWIEGGATIGNANTSIVMNTELVGPCLSGELVNAMVNTWKQGGLSRESLLEWFRRMELLPEGRTIEEEKALIHGKARG
jgi:hypothetical protein